MGADGSLPIILCLLVSDCSWPLYNTGLNSWVRFVFHSKCYSTPWFTVGWIWPCGTRGMEELLIPRNAYMEGQLCGRWAPLTPIPPPPPWYSRVSCVQSMGLWWNLATETWRELSQLLLRKFSSLFKRGQREEIHPSSSSFGFCCIWNMMPRTAVCVLRSRKGASLRQRGHVELCQAKAASERRSWSPANLTDCLPYFWVLLVMKDTSWAGRDC